MRACNGCSYSKPVGKAFPAVAEEDQRKSAVLGSNSGWWRCGAFQRPWRTLHAESWRHEMKNRIACPLCVQLPCGDARTVSFPSACFPHRASGPPLHHHLWPRPTPCANSLVARARPCQTRPDPVNATTRQRWAPTPCRWAWQPARWRAARACSSCCTARGTLVPGASHESPARFAGCLYGIERSRAPVHGSIPSTFSLQLGTHTFNRSASAAAAVLAWRWRHRPASARF